MRVLCSLTSEKYEYEETSAFCSPLSLQFSASKITLCYMLTFRKPNAGYQSLAQYSMGLEEARFGFSSSRRRKIQGRLECRPTAPFPSSGSATQARDVSCLQLSNFGCLFALKGLATSRRKSDCTAPGSVVTLRCLDISREGGGDSGLSPVETLPGDLEPRD